MEQELIAIPFNDSKIDALYYKVNRSENDSTLNLIQLF